MTILSIQDLDIKDKRVLVRVDFNVPLTPNGDVADAGRIKATIPTIQHITKNGGKCIIISHLGRPEGKKNPKYSLDVVARCLEKLMGQKVKFVDDCIGDKTLASIIALKPGEIALLENVRFYKEEEENSEEFAEKLALLGDIYVNDAFGTCHRAHASVSSIPKYIPSAAGFLLKKEIVNLNKVLLNPERPFVAILGGAKVSDKIRVIGNLLTKVDKLLIGGGMAYTFLKAQGKNVGISKVEIDKLPFAKDILSKTRIIVLPTDSVIAERIDKEAITKVVKDDIPDNWLGLDIGPESIANFISVLSTAKTVLWNGPVGVFEIPQFSNGTKTIAEHLSHCRATTIVGGGDTAAAVEKFGVTSKMTHVSTGGGASLEFLEGRELPGIAALKRT